MWNLLEECRNKNCFSSDKLFSDWLRLVVHITEFCSFLMNREELWIHIVRRVLGIGLNVEVRNGGAASS